MGYLFENEIKTRPQEFSRKRLNVLFNIFEAFKQWEEINLHYLEIIISKAVILHIYPIIKPLLFTLAVIGMNEIIPQPWLVPVEDEALS